MIDATNLDFIIYNIPQTTGYSLSVDLYKRMLEKPQVIGVKNSSMPVQDILTFKLNATKDVVLFNGPDEQFIAGRLVGADGGIGGTYGVMPELFLAADKALIEGKFELAQSIQLTITDIILTMVQAKGNLYDVMKIILKREGLDIGRVRGPLAQTTQDDETIIEKAHQMIKDAKAKYC